MKQTTRNLTSFFHWLINLPCALTGSNPAIGSAATCTHQISFCFTMVYLLSLSLSIYTATCTDLTPPNNGVITYNPTRSPRLQGTTATHNCNTGYKLSGGTVRTCQSDRAWSGGSITCPSKVLDSGLLLYLVILYL